MIFLNVAQNISHFLNFSLKIYTELLVTRSLKALDKEIASSVCINLDSDRLDCINHIGISPFM